MEELETQTLLRSEYRSSDFVLRQLNNLQLFHAFKYETSSGFLNANLKKYGKRNAKQS